MVCREYVYKRWRKQGIPESEMENVEKWAFGDVSNEHFLVDSEEVRMLAQKYKQYYKEKYERKKRSKNT